MAQPRACVNKTSTTYPVYASDLTTVIGHLYPNECYAYGSGAEASTWIYFQNPSGNVVIGWLKSTNSPLPTNYMYYKASGNQLVANTTVTASDGNKYYTHTIKTGYDMNWYIGTTKQNTTLPAGTILYTNDSSAGASYPYRMYFVGYKKPNGTFTKPNSGNGFWVDFLSIGTHPYNRVLL